MSKVYSIFIEPLSVNEYNLLKSELLNAGFNNTLISNGKQYNAPDKLFFYESKTKERMDVFNEINSILEKNYLDAKIIIMQTEGRLWYGLDLYKDK